MLPISTLKGFASIETLSGFQVLFFMRGSQGCRCAPTIGLKLANAFGVFNLAEISERLRRFFFKLNQYLLVPQGHKWIDFSRTSRGDVTSNCGDEQ
jgi:hypothetical protein